ncbi:hypothetical protein QLQ12_34460 [Actinoplanes sp. NEAU-A12]|uniref:Anti-sigma factor n=1 Tax=Actinoplanes sandaracinus TaxID=3045177 RepID=A0ABT6WVS6_9ACTN|nr:hypothetical protein [Actinoplanes sandaracinus]MDI6103730.1 hypothetical protein [Actinoplanes sandaracinus]
MASHPSEGLLRRLLDEPDGVADVDRDHVGACPECRSRMDAASADALLVASALRCDADVDVDAGWQRLRGALTEPAPKVATRKKFTLRSPVIAVVGVMALLGGASAAAAGDWFQIFRAEKIAPVTVDQADLVRLPDLSAFGTLTVVEKPNLRRVEDAREAREVTGLPSPLVDDLPQGVTGAPQFTVGDRIRGVFRFDAEKARQATGQALPAPPAGMENSEFSLTAGPGMAAVWPEARGVPALIVGRVAAPKGFSTGIPFETARDYLLSLPGLPAGVADQLRSFTKEPTTLPLIVKSGTETSFTTDVNGLPATVLATRDGTLAAVVWVDKGYVTGVGGSLSTDEVLEVARALRWKK